MYQNITLRRAGEPGVNRFVLDISIPQPIFHGREVSVKYMRGNRLLEDVELLFERRVKP